MSQPQKILSFDIGIKNLAWCILTVSGEIFTINGWSNYNLVTGTETEDKELQAAMKCSSCKAQAKYMFGTQKFCGRHYPADKSPPKDASGNIYSKLPPLPILKALSIQNGLEWKNKKKDDLVTQLATKICLPILKHKLKHDKAMDMTDLHDSLRKFIETQLVPHLHSITEVRIENQPVMKNPIMKTVQMMLYATLRDTFYSKYPTQKPPQFRLVHAKVKVQGAEKGDAGYKARKEGSEARVLETLRKNKVTLTQQWLDYFQGHKKRSDLADAFCMCLDGVRVNDA